MALNPSIILAGQPVNALGSMQAGLSLAEQQNGVSQQNALANLYKTQGAGIANGDPAALNALAGFSPQAAVDIRGAQQGQAFDAEKMNMLRAEWKTKTTDRAAAMSAAERAAKAAEIERSVAAGLAAQTPEQWDQIVTGMGATDLVGQFDNRTAIAFSYMGVADALKAAQGPDKPEWREATPEEAAARGAIAGQINDRTGKFDAQNPPSGMSIESDGSGGFKINQGPGVTGGGKKLTEGQSKLTLFQNMQAETAPVIDGLENQFDPANFADKAAGAIPIVGTYFESEEYQLYKTAAAAWAEGALRISTGAAATQPEIERLIMTYFAVPGNSPKVVAFKSRMREMYARSIGLALGGGDPGEKLEVPDLSEEEIKFLSGE